MNDKRCYIAGMGIISPLGSGIDETTAALKRAASGIKPLTLFPTPLNRKFPAGQVAGTLNTPGMPRTHQLARLAADQTMAECPLPPDAIVLGVCTGGMPTTEVLLKNSDRIPTNYSHHGVGSVAEDIANRYQCKGPVITVSTACSSSAAAIKIALEMIRSGRAERVLAGGADALCRMTYYGFSSLQLIDAMGARPLDKDRRGMSVSEGAAMLLLTADKPGNAWAEILGAGLSCDAYHPVAPHPQGAGALAAIKAAVQDAGIPKKNIDYINLHGTGTIENDLSEARAVNTFFAKSPPPLSSVKGAFGHSLGASGAIETVVSAISIHSGIIPGNIGCQTPDPDLGFAPVLKPRQLKISTVLSNSFGFGGNNAALVIGASAKSGYRRQRVKPSPFIVVGKACLTGAGDTQHTFEKIFAGNACKGTPLQTDMTRELPSRTIRRLKQLPRLALALTVSAQKNSGTSQPPSSIFFGTAWGALSETSDFLTRLFETNEQFPSPTDFSASVHNAPAGQVAMLTKASGPNITTSGGDYSFEQALLSADLLTGETNSPILLLGADEAHPVLSPLFDPSTALDKTLSGGGGGLLLVRRNASPCSGLSINLAFYENVDHNPDIISCLVRKLGGPQKILDRYGAILTGIPGSLKNKAQKQIESFISLSGFSGPVIDYRTLTGEFGSASAVAAVIATMFLEHGSIPGGVINSGSVDLEGKGILIIGLGAFVTAMETGYL
jgi:3-oxoacyl-[acyl-carrier-protein] synthase-1/3-oxoacyl-[acyl-carrier-protein] synthase II